MKRMQKLVFSCIAMTTLLAVGRVGYAEEPAYPARPIKIVVGFPAGGANDVVARSIGLELARELHQSVVVENISGAAGTIGAATVARAQPDGYTLLMGAGAHALAPSMRKASPTTSSKTLRRLAWLRSEPTSWSLTRRARPPQSKNSSPLPNRSLAR